MKKLQFLAMAIVLTFAFTGSAKAVCTTVGCSANLAIHEIGGSIWDSCATAGQDATKLGKCIHAWLNDPKNAEEKKTVGPQLISELTSACTYICSEKACTKHFGFGGDTNCKAICCTVGLGHLLTKCCAAAKDKQCCTGYTP